MIVLYDSRETEFKTLGLGTLTDFIEKPSITEKLNGEYYLEFEYFRGGKNFEYLLEDNLIKDLGQIFRIETIEPDLTKIKVLARHLVYDLKDNFILDAYPKDLTAQSALDWMLSKAETNTKFEVSGTSAKIASARYQKVSVFDAIFNADNAVLKRFGGEIECDNYHIIIHERRGTETNLEIREKKNLQGLEIEKDYSSIKTRLLPKGRDGITLPEKFIDSENIGLYFQPKIGVLEVETEEEDTEEEAYEKMRNAVAKEYENGIDLPFLSIKVDFTELSQVKEYEQYKSLQTAHLGDTIRVYVPSLQTNIKVRIIKTVKDGHTGKITKLELGSETKDIISSIKTSISSTKNEISEATQQTLENFKFDATEIMNHPFGGHLLISEDTGELFIMDTTDVNTAKNIWKWGLGGLGFSSNGINGPYNTAWTQDGKFVADFIATGKLSVERIEGIQQLILAVSKAYNFIEEVSGVNKLIIEKAQTGNPIELHITGEMEVSFLEENQYLEEEQYLLGSFLVIENSMGEKNRVELPITHLYSLDDVSDEFVFEQIYNENIKEYETKVSIIRRIELDSEGNKKIAMQEKTEFFDIFDISLFKGINKIYMESFDGLNYSIKYAIINEITEAYTPLAEFNTQMIQTEQEIKNLATEKLGNDTFEAYRKLTAKDIEDKVSSNDFETYREQTDKSITEKVSSSELASEFVQSVLGFKLEGKYLLLDFTNCKLNETGIMNLTEAIMKDCTIDGGEIILNEKKDEGSARMIINSYDGTTSYFRSNQIRMYNGTRYVDLSLSSNASLLLQDGYGSVNITPYFGINIANSSNAVNIQLKTDGSIICKKLTESSLEESKKNFEKFVGALEIIKDIDLYKYNLKDESDYVKKHIGFVIGKNYNYSNEITSEDESGKEIGVDLYSMTSLCLQAIKEQQEEIEKLKEIITKG